jgi:phosphatidylserine decarboxylase
MARYARLEVGAILVAGLGLTLLTAWLAGWWALLPAVMAGLLLSFYRDPHRATPADPQAVFAAADGRIVEVTREADAGLGPVIRIMTFLSVANVHVNRSPCAARVVATEYQRGRFRSALSPAADRENENNILILEPPEGLPGPVRVRQIAGILARRIVCVAQPGMQLAAGERFGMIKLGSRTEVCVPEDPGWHVCVQVGDAVRAGQTVLLRYGRGDGDQR